MRKLLIVCLLLCAAVPASKAQEYNWGVGIRGGVETSGFAAKYNFDPKNALEATLSIQSGVLITVLYEHHIPVIAQGFNFYFGAGGHIGSWNRHSGGVKKFAIGAEAVAGLEYKVPGAPVAMAIDYRPMLNIGAASRFYADDIGLSIKYTF